jgi:STE24 endopeptidase
MKYLIIAFFCLLTQGTAIGQTTTQDKPSTPPAAIHFDPEKATQSWISTIPEDIRRKADTYSEGGYWLILWNFVVAALVAWLFLFGGLSTYIKKKADKSPRRNASNLVYILLYFLLTWLLTLPLDFYQNFIREHQYGFSNQNFVQWFTTDVTTFLVELVIAGPFLVLIYRVFRKVKEKGWWWGAGISVICTILVIVVYPIFIAPLFNNYIPLKEAALKQRIMSMARANEVNIDQVYVYDESQQTKAFNANASGIGNTARISLNDNILNHCTDDEITAILGHEMGHYVLNHLIILSLEFGMLIVIGFGFVKWAFNKLAAKYGGRWGISSIQDVTSLPVLVFLFTFYFFIMTPVSNSIIRTVETEADNYGLNTAREPDAIASVFIKTADNNKIAPGYWEEIFFYDHPCRQKRILRAMKWKAENLTVR